MTRTRINWYFGFLAGVWSEHGGMGDRRLGGCSGEVAYSCQSNSVRKCIVCVRATV